MDHHQSKRAFIRRLLANYKHRTHGVNFLLRYILSNDLLIDKIEFTQNCNYSPRGIYISYKPESEQDFIYYKDQFAYFMEEQAFHDMRLKQDEYYHIEIILPEPEMERELEHLLIENPYVPGYLSMEDKCDIELNQLADEAYIKYLEDLLNQAIDEKDYQRLEEIADQLEKLWAEP